MAREQVIKLVERLVEEIIQNTELSLVEVEYVKERDWYLRVFLDKAGGVEVEDCQWVSERLEAKLDELDPIQGSYYLEVSSPGLDRPLKNEKDFVRHQGEKVEVHLYSPLDGEKLIVGALQGLTDNQVALLLENGQEKQISRDKISLVRLYIDF